MPAVGGYIFILRAKEDTMSGAHGNSFMENDVFEVVGRVTDNLPNTLFKVEIVETPLPELKGETILCHLSGKMRMHYIKILPGDKVKVQVTGYDLGKGRITYREKG